MDNGVFSDISALGHFDNSNVIHVACLKFCFMSLIQEEMHRVSQNWNLHRIRPSNGETPFLSEESNTSHYKIEADESDVDVAENLCGCAFISVTTSPKLIVLLNLSTHLFGCTRRRIFPSRRKLCQYVTMEP